MSPQFSDGTRLSGQPIRRVTISVVLAVTHSFSRLKRLRTALHIISCALMKLSLHVKAPAKLSFYFRSPGNVSWPGQQIPCVARCRCLIPASDAPFCWVMPHDPSSSKTVLLLRSSPRAALGGAPYRKASLSSPQAGPSCGPPSPQQGCLSTPVSRRLLDDNGRNNVFSFCLPRFFY